MCSSRGLTVIVDFLIFSWAIVLNLFATFTAPSPAAKLNKFQHGELPERLFEKKTVQTIFRSFLAQNCYAHLEI